MARHTAVEFNGARRRSGWPIAAAALLACASLLARGETAVLLTDPPAAGQSAEPWGPLAQCQLSSNGIFDVHLGASIKPCGASLSFPTADVVGNHARQYLVCDIRGAPGNESLTFSLRDAFGCQVEANLPDGFRITNQWRTCVLPLTDFPVTGENWSASDPANPSGPKRTPIDWSHLTGLGIGKWSGTLSVSLRHIVVTTDAATGPGTLLGAFAVPASIDLSRGRTLRLAAQFVSPTRWTLQIVQAAAKKSFSGVSDYVDVVWDGAADVGEFQPGGCDVRLEYGNGTRRTLTRALNVLAPHSPRVQVSQPGYLPKAIKTACVMGEPSSRRFRVVSAASGKTVLDGWTSRPMRVAQADDVAASIDFSAVREPGEYYLDVAGVGRSYVFAVRGDVLTALSVAAMKSYYFQRCGEALLPAYAGRHARPACHLDDAYAYAGSTDDTIVRGPRHPSAGGWHDAGDYGKKVVAASDALGYLLMACEDLPERAEGLHLNVPGHAALPDMWREIQYELDWFFTEQEPDGSVQALITSQDFFLNGMPEQDPQPRFRVGVSSCATADFAAIMARASRVYARFDAAYADRCLSAARRAWSWLTTHPQIVPAGGYHDPAGIHGTGTYDDADDRDERFWAASELYVTTGESDFNRWVRRHCDDFGAALFQPPGYLHTQGFGVYAYVLSPRGDADLRQKFRAAILAYAAQARDAIRASPYGITADLTPYWWNNCTALQSSAALVVAERLQPKAGYGDAAWRQLFYGLGCNPVDRCYVTGFGARPVSDPWQPASVYDGVGTAIPGFVLPGANLVAWDLPLQRYREVHHLAPLKAYRDDHRMASVNEVCLNYNGPFVFVTLALGR